MLSFKIEAEPGTWCRACNWDCKIYEEASEVEGVAMSAAGIGCWPLPQFKFEPEPEPERDQACPALWLQGFRLLLKSLALARYHRPEQNDGLVISDATAAQVSLSPPWPALLSVHLRVLLLGKHSAHSPHLKLFFLFYEISLTHFFITTSYAKKISADYAEFQHTKNDMVNSHKHLSRSDWL